MFKKNSWIVVLIMALTLAPLFTGCIEAFVDPDADMTYTEVELGEFNIWGGQTYQRGWAVAGMKFLGVGDKAEVAADNGYKNENFQKATKLIIEMEDATHPNGNLDIIWGAADASGGTVGKDWIQTGGIKSSKDGNILTIDLTAMKDYASFKGGNYAMRKLVLQAGAEKAGLPFVKKATLLIPDKVPFVAVKDIALVKDNFYFTNDLQLTAEGKFTPDNATNQIVNWSIKSWKSKDGITTISPTYPTGQGTDSSKPDYNANYATELAAYNAARTALLAKVAFKPKTIVIRPPVVEEKQPDTELWDWSVQPPAKVTVAGDGQVLVPARDGQTYTWHEDDIIVAADEKDSMGTVVVVATIINGVSMPVGEQGKDGYKAGVNFVKEFTITINDPPVLKLQIDDADVEVFYYGAVDNSGNGPSEFTTKTPNGYKFDMGGGYGNSYYYIRIKLAAGDKFENYKGIKFKYKGISGDSNVGGKTLRVKAMKTVPPSTYNPGKYLTSLVGNEMGANGEFDGEFGVDHAQIYLNTTDTTDQAACDAKMKTNFDEFKDENTLYIWIIPWAGAAVFEITDINIYK